MAAVCPGRLWSWLTGVELVMGLLWLGLAAFTIALVVLIWTRWGQYRPLRKCLVLSVLAHLLLAGYATTVRIVTMTPPANGPIIAIRLGDLGGPGANGDDPAGGLETPQPAAKASPPLLEIPNRPTPAPSPPSPSPPPPAATAVLDKPIVPSPSGASGEPLSPAAQPEEPLAAASAAGNRISAMASTSTWQRRGASRDLSPAAAQPQGGSAHPVPEVYRLRMAPNHAGLAQGHGGSPQTEAAVQAALQWLAANQSGDGHWSARQHGAGRETWVDGRDRQHAGAEADSGITGLALLAFLAAGQTHRDGPHTAEVRRGLEYLLSVQAADGNLAGQADVFARMYSHAMAAFALSEAYAMTGDARLRDGVRHAVAYSVAAQDVYGGGWRYRPGDPGDTSQLGWQWMALKSAELAGIPSGEPTRQGIMRFLRSVASGSYGGLAAYRPGEQVTRTMTAEALVCWQFLGMPPKIRPATRRGSFCSGNCRGGGPSTSTTGTTAPWRCSSCRGNIGASGTKPCKPSCSPASARPAPRPAVGTPTPPGAATAGGSTARRSRRCAWRSTTGSCRCTRRRRSGEKRGRACPLPTGRSRWAWARSREQRCLPSQARRLRPAGTGGLPSFPLPGG